MRRESRGCGTDLEAEASAEAARLEKTHDRGVLARLIAAGGVDATDATDAADATEPGTQG
jgi:hypothetical protein